MTATWSRLDEIASMIKATPGGAERVMADADDLLEMALFYAREYGWPVFPCRQGTKVPATPRGCLDATTDEAVIRRWWNALPLANLAVATGSPGPDVLDVDVKPAGDGWTAWRDLVNAGDVRTPMFVASTRNGGAHMYYAGSAAGNRSFADAYVDVRAKGGYVLAPPSFVHPDQGTPGTGEYAWKVPGRGFLAAGGPLLSHEAVVARLRGQAASAQNWVGDYARDLAGRLGQEFTSTAGLHEVVREAGEGNRNNALFWALATLFAEQPDMGLNHEESAAMISAAVANGLTHREAYRTAVSAWRKAHGAGQ